MGEVVGGRGGTSDAGGWPWWGMSALAPRNGLGVAAAS